MTATTHKCRGCGADLSEKDTVRREYINKDDGASAFNLGHYEPDGTYEPDHFTDLSGGRYDLCDGSDTCIYCDEVVG